MTVPYLSGNTCNFERWIVTLPYLSGNTCNFERWIVTLFSEMMVLAIAHRQLWRSELKRYSGMGV